MMHGPSYVRFQRKFLFPSPDFIEPNHHYKAHTDTKPEFNYSNYNRFKVSVVLFTGFEKWNLHNVFVFRQVPILGLLINITKVTEKTMFRRTSSVLTTKRTLHVKYLTYYIFHKSVNEQRGISF